MGAFDSATIARNDDKQPAPRTTLLDLLWRISSNISIPQIHIHISSHDERRLQ